MAGLGRCGRKRDRPRRRRLGLLDAHTRSAHAKLGDSAAQLDVRSDFFLVRSRAEVGDVVVELASRLHRDAGSGVIRVFGRSFGDPFDWPPVAPDALAEAT